MMLSTVTRRGNKKDDMKHKLPANLLALGALVFIFSYVHAQAPQEFREEFHHTYTLNPEGRVSLENVTGDVNIKVWQRNEVKVDVIKRAYSRDRLEEAEVKVKASPEVLFLSTKYKSSSNTWNFNDEGRLTNPATVEYTLTVPSGARLDTIQLVNGALNIEDVSGDVEASSVNGPLTARNLTGEVKLSTVNGTLEARFERIAPSMSGTFTSVNGQVVLLLQGSADAELTASTVQGELNNDFGLSIERGARFGRKTSGVLGSGGSRFKLNNVNGNISILRISGGNLP
jgi:DUF4097 and DUF4098 domain-containing protein YvlB